MKTMQVTTRNELCTVVGPTRDNNVSKVVVFEAASFIVESTACNKDSASSALELGVKGKPLARSAGIDALAQVAAAHRGAKPKNANAWASKLANDLTQPHD